MINRQVRNHIKSKNLIKINLLSPAQVDKFITMGKVKKAERTIKVFVGDLFAVSNNQRKLVAIMNGTLMTGTFMTIPGREDLNS
jgi:acyl-coenzyme A thioesterase PaaI-like protein